MKIGDYVRNQYGIAKVINIENNDGLDMLVFNNNICFAVDYRTGKRNEDIPLFNKLPLIKTIDLNKIKSSPNIIDLIEEGDFINQLPVFKNKYGELYTSYVYYGGDIGKQCEVYTTWLKEYTEDMIETIVTHEHFEQMEYKL